MRIQIVFNESLMITDNSVNVRVICYPLGISQIQYSQISLIISTKNNRLYKMNQVYLDIVIILFKLYSKKALLKLFKIQIIKILILFLKNSVVISLVSNVVNKAQIFLHL
ncbi:unnamed protein product [Paramecium sonneborni]|uniref:Uncharacterized protein n=1 Tax=Paramecium sonneborni TaxID=65129 RepID=A0A8S1LDA5_9CILI|nr:unnamed protein product [Paramecium sonneborni]